MDFKFDPVTPVVRSFEQITSDPLPKAPSLVDGLVRIRGRLMIGGEPGVGKTTLALQLALALATGSSFLGLSVGRAFNVLYAQAEIETDLLEEKWEAQAKQFPPPFGRLHSYTAMPWIWDEQVKLLVEVIEHLGIEVLFLDPLFAICPADDSNSNSQMSQFLRHTLDGLRQYCDLKGLVVVHHFKKPQPGYSGSDVSSLSKLSGAGELGNWADAFIGLLGTRQTADALIEFDKIRAFEPKEPMLVTRNANFVYEDAAWQLQAIAKLLSDGEWHARDEVEALGISHERSNKLLRDAIKLGEVEPDNKGGTKRIRLVKS